MTPTRTTCYHHLATKAAEVMGLVDYRNPDDIFKAIIAGKKVDHLEIARKIVNEALDQMRDDHG
jgi:ferritin-like metal-binding protein YciE